MEKIVGVVTEDEKKEIEKLYEKKIALENLSKIIDINNNDLYEKLLLDYGKTINLFNKWWFDMSQKYKWKGEEWTINFESNEIIIK